MVTFTLFHQNVPVTHHVVSGDRFTIGADPENDLVLAGDGVRDTQLVLIRDDHGRWRARYDGGEGCLQSSRIELGDYALEVDMAGELIEMKKRDTNLSWAGISAALQLLMTEVKTMAPLSAPVLISGETGTGKELVARGVHDLSGRSGPFVSVNCGSLTESLLEDTLFGHERGSFTGAGTRSKGIFEQAHGGTLFLDEIGELPLPHQAALLRILEERNVRRIGAEQVTSVNFRLVAATNRDLKSLSKRRLFRADLYHRIATLTMETTPLRHRLEDVVPLANRFLSEMAPELGHKTLDDAAKARLRSYSWPGNVRELKNVLYRAAALTPRHALGSSDFSVEADLKKGAHFKLGAVPLPQLERFVQTFDGNITQAARALGVARTTLRDRLGRAAPEAAGSVAVDLAV